MGDITSSVQSIAGGDVLVLAIVGAVIVGATIVASRVATKVIRSITQSDGNPLPSSSILVNIARGAIWLIGLSTVLSVCFGVDVNALVAALGIGGVALSLGLQQTLENFIGGLQITLMGILHPGDHISVDGVEGIVQDVTWRQTKVRRR